MIRLPRVLLDEAFEVAADSAVAAIAGAQPIAIGWATVELDRAATELAGALGLADDAFEPTARSPTLGCACRVARDVLGDRRSIVLLEPDTEGRLAATLARLGEGPSVAWLEAPDPAAASAALRSAGIALSTERDGPLGPEWLLEDGAIRGPHRLLVGRPAGTIRA